MRPQAIKQCMGMIQNNFNLFTSIRINGMEIIAEITSKEFKAENSKNDVVMAIITRIERRLNLNHDL